MMELPAIVFFAVMGVMFLAGRWAGIQSFESRYMPALDRMRARVQYLVDGWPLETDDKGITFPDGEFWAETKK